MLGSIKSAHTWQWTICGKHPVTRDYFQSGSDDSLLMAFSEWTDKGYRLLKDQQRRSERVVSWRFWAQGVKKDIIVCGVVKDSTDRVGRPFPILIAGTGMLENWKNHWDLLPFALEKTWAQMDYLCSKRYNIFNHLEEDMHTIRPPEPLWHQYTQNRKEQYESALNSHGVFSLNIPEYRKQMDKLSRQPCLRILIDQGLSANALTPLGMWYTFLKDTLNNFPNAVFTGGIGDLTYLAVFMHALSSGDFVRLWSDSNFETI